MAAGASLGGTLLRRRLRGAGGEAAAALVGFMPALFALRGGELAAYHGVEHKAIGAYEADDQDAADATKEHERCGSHLVAPMLASNLAGTLLLRRAVERPGPLAGMAVALASSAVAVEVFAWCERHAETRAARALQAPGLRDPASGRHARAGRAPARGRTRRARRDPARRGGRRHVGAARLRQPQHPAQPGAHKRLMARVRPRRADVAERVVEDAPAARAAHPDERPALATPAGEHPRPPRDAGRVHVELLGEAEPLGHAVARRDAAGA